MSLANCLKSHNFSDKDSRELVSLAIKIRMKTKMSADESEKQAVQEILDAALADQKMVVELIHEAMGLPMPGTVVRNSSKAEQTVAKPADTPEDVENDRDNFILERLNRDTNKMEKVSFERGEYITYRIGGKSEFGDIDGISHDRREFSVDGLWHPFGYAYKAERPAPVEKPTVPLSSVIDSVNKKFGEGLDYKDRIHTLSVHDDLFERIRNGDVSEDEFKASFNSLLNNEAALTAELGKMTKPQLLSRGLPYWAKNEKKEKVVRAAYRAMLDSFVLGDSISWSMGEKYEDVIQAYVDRTTEADIKKYAELHKAANESRNERVAQVAVAVKDPKTLDDFIAFFNANANAVDGITFAELRMKLMPEQRALYDELAGEKTRSERKARADQQKTEVKVSSQTTGANIVEGIHTKFNYPIWSVQLDERLDPENYKTLLGQAKRMGGTYVNAMQAKMWKTVWGFQFKDQSVAEAFMKLAAGDTAAATEVVQTRRDAYKDDQSQSAVERLNEMADRLEERADESLGRDRKANTDRRSRFAASAEAAASSDKALAKTMRNIAQAISDGKAKFLDRVRQKTQVEMLRGMVRDAQHDQLAAKYQTYAEQEKHRGEKPTGETADYAKFPSFTAYRSDLARLARELQATDGAIKLGDRLAKVADDVTASYIKFAKENLHKVSTFKTNTGDAIFASKDQAEEAIRRSGFKGKAIVLPFKRGQNIIIQSPSAAKEKGIWPGDDDKRITLNTEFGAEIVAKANARGIDRMAMPWVFESANDKINRLKAIGIETPAELRAALREFISVQEQAAAPDKIKAMERAMIGRRNDGLDFFPTPTGVAREMVETADIKEGMTVLEPSAGMGHIAERIREAGVEPDVVEMAVDRRELLTEKGFNLVGSDFMDVTGEYDRIVMNPPFSNRRDIEHVRHAYELLKPGGRLVAIMGEGSFFGSDKKATEFRDWLDSLNGTSEKLYEGTFMDPTLPVNTGTNARLVVMDKPESAKFSQSTQPVSNPHTPTTLRTAIDQSEGQGFAARLEATGNFIIETSSNKQDGRVLAYVQDGVVHLIADNISQSDNVGGLLRHEISAHALQLGQSDAEFQAILKQVEQSLDPKVKAARARVPDDTPAHLVSEETLGYLLETNPTHSVSKRFLSWFRAQLRKLAGSLKGLERMKFMKWANDLQVDDLIWMANKSLKTAPETLGEAKREGLFKADTQRWFSPLLKALRDARQDTMPAAQWGLWINANKAKYGLKDDEIQWSGILDYLTLRGKDKVTKAEIADYLSGNGVKVEDVVKGQSWRATLTGDNVETFSSRQEAEERIKAENDWVDDESMSVDADEDAGYIQVNDFDGNQYAYITKNEDDEWVLTEKSYPLDDYDQETFYDFDSASERAEEIADEQRDYWRDQISDEPEEKETSTSAKFAGYWESSYKGGIPGTYREILVTLPTREDSRNKRLAEIEKQLSDPALPFADVTRLTEEKDAIQFKKARTPEKGFIGSHWNEPNVLVHLRTDEVMGADGKRYLRVGEIQSDWGQNGKKEGFKPFYMPHTVEPSRFAEGFWAVMRPDGVMATQRATRENAQQQADILNSHDLGVPAAPFVTDTKAWVALGIKRAIMHAMDVGADGIVLGTGQQNADLYDLSKQVDYIDYVKSAPDRYNMAVVGKNGDEVFSENAITLDRIEEVVGKDVAAKIANGEGQSGGGRMTLRGLDLKVGGTGMKAFYDTIIPSVANEVLRKVGIVGKMVSVDTEGGKQPGFTITPEAREKISKQGMPLFSKAANPEIRYSKRTVIGDSGRVRTPEQEQMFRNVGRETNVDSTLDKIKKFADQKWTQGLFDQFEPIKALSHYAYRTARLAKGSAGAFDALMNHGKLSIVDGAYDADQSGGVMERVFNPLGKESTDFLYWIAGNRADRLMQEEREHLFTDDDIIAALTLAEGTTDFDYTLLNGTTTRNRQTIYEDSLKKFNEFNRNVMDMAEQSGLIDPVSRKYWEHEFYVPFYRVNEDEQGGFRGMNMKQGVVRQQAFKQLKGGNEGLNDLLANTLMNWAHLIDASVKNRAAKATLDSAEQVGAARPAKPGEKKTVWYMGDITKQVPEGTEYEEDGVTMTAGPNTFITYVGKKEYVVEDSGLMVAIEGLDFAGFRGIAMDILSKPKHYLTIGVTASPFYKIRNLIRDTVQSIAVAPLSYNPAKNIAQGRKLAKTDQAFSNFGKELANMVTAGKSGLKQKNEATPEYVSALAAGGLIRFGTMLEGNDASRTRQLIKQGANDAHILDSENKFRQFYDKYLEPSIAAYNELGNKGEEVNRIALYDQLVKGGMSKAEAAFMARDLMDFSLQGSFTLIRLLAQLVPFFNSRLQGIYKLVRASNEDRARMGYVIGAVTLASLALLAAYGDDDDWKKREDWDRDNYWWFKIGGTAFRIPKPFEIGAIATLAERSAELMFSDEMTGKRFRETTSALLWNQLSMNPTPQVFKPILDIYANKDSFRKRPIETMGMERLDPEYRFNAGTSMVARGASTATGGFLSPVQIDHLVRGYFAWLGTFIVSGTDMLIRAASDEPTRPALDMFKLASGGLVADVDSGSSRYVSQMYDQASELETAYSTWRALKKAGKREEAAEYKKDNLEQIRKRDKVARAKEQVSEQNKRIRKIEQSDLTPDEKRRRILKIRKLQNEVARALATR